MPSQLVLTSFSGVFVGALGAMLTIVLCMIGKRAIEEIEFNLWLAAELMRI